MITDRNEAFKHNSCKKLAQLAKVIFQMSSLTKDRLDELRSITIHYESSLTQLVRQHHRIAEGISKDLVQFRKNCIDKACQDYGSAYKNVKANYSNLCKSQFQKLQNIYDECHLILQQINDLKVNSIKESELISKTAATVKSELAAVDKKYKSEIKKRVSTAIQPINAKITKYQSELDKKIRQIKAQHAIEVREKRVQINKIFNAEVYIRKPQFIQIRHQFEALENENKMVKEKYNEINTQYYENFEKLRYQKNTLISNTKNLVKEHKLKLAEMQKREKSKKSERIAEISELKQYLQNLIKNHQADINNLINQVNQQKHQRHQFMNSRASEIEKQRSDFESRLQQLIKQHEKNIKDRQFKLNRLIELIEESDNDMMLLKKHLQQLIDASIEKVKLKQTIFQKKIATELTKARSQKEKDTTEFRELARERIRALNQALQGQDELNYVLQSENRKNIHDLLVELKSLQATINSEMTNKSKQVSAEKEKVQSANLARQKQKKEEIDKQVLQKKNLRDKEFKNLQDKYSKDLNAQIEERKKENGSKLEEYKKSIENLGSTENEEKQHQMEFNRLKGKLTVAINSIKKAQDEGEKTINFLTNKMQNTEKEFRQVQRRIEKETNSIDEEYEMKIQVEQVKLNNAIENLAKLYDKEENQRGVDLIEMIRKVRESKNKADDFVQRKKKEIENDNVEYNKQKTELTKELENLTAKKQEKDLKGKLEATLRYSKSSLSKIENEFKEKLTQVQDQIDKVGGAQMLKIQKVRQDMTKAEAEYQIKVAEIHSQKQEITKTTSQAINKLQNEYEQKQKKLVDSHSQVILKLKQRIESAKKVQANAITDSSNEIKDAKKNDADLIARKCSDDLKSLENVSKTFIEKDHALADSIMNLSKTNGDSRMKLENPPIRKIDQQQITNRKENVTLKDGEIREIFENCYSKIDQLAKSQTAPLISPSFSNQFNSGASTTDESDSSSSAKRVFIREPQPPKEPSEPPANNGRNNSRRSSRSARGSRSEIPKVSMEVQKKNVRTVRAQQVA
ncbi:hypothetical protein TRFO_06325 [Tritrichomonas foetus]|uniref:Uncharacterized protein n=1 Tax=Tritrichomonas foetus TaxID=1144522 RepID=A0A1J4JZ46_9EUKA|nr:hypothetical protein TRFO_06325 [Tritrichomonas foetus]|eukprot:OHT04433.1 hypothetical protein TRFO_06325 [Tritrichomonas foetus]